MDPIMLLMGAGALYFLTQDKGKEGPPPYDPDMVWPGTDSPAQLTPKQRDAIRRKQREERDRATVPPPGSRPGTHIPNGSPPAAGLPGMIPGMASPTRREHAMIVPAGLTPADAPPAMLGTPEEMLASWWATVESAPALSGVLTWDFGAVNSGVAGGSTWAEFPGRAELLQVVSQGRAVGAPMDFQWFVDRIANETLPIPGGHGPSDRANILFWMVPREGVTETEARNAWASYVALQTGAHPLWYLQQAQSGRGRPRSPGKGTPRPLTPEETKSEAERLAAGRYWSAS